MLHVRWIRILAGLILTIGIVLLSPLLLHAKGKFNVIARLQNGGSQLDILTYIDPEIDSPKNRVGLLGITNSSVRNSFSFRLDGWNKIMALWSKAVEEQSDSWKTIGAIGEKGTRDGAQLGVSAGPVIRFVIESPAQGAVTYNFSKADQARFVQALNRIRGFLSE
jgi:hypothetical protein